MSEPTITISLNYTVPAKDALATLQRLLASLPAGAAVTGADEPSLGRSWPPVPPAAGAAYKLKAQYNLAALQSGEIPDEGWGSVTNLDDILRPLRPEIRKVVRRAIENGGHVSRDEVYELLERDRKMSLTGFTRPIASLTGSLVAAGELTNEAAMLLVPIYKKSKSFQQAQGFAVPLQVVSLWQQQGNG